MIIIILMIDSFIIINVILPPYIEIYKVFNLYLAVVFEILRFIELILFSCIHHFICCLIMAIRNDANESLLC